ncbi:MAG: hypothetical protein TQ35_0008260 [Candidatus Aramenus sulfurataquae]|nr:hypothetical protein [Candidatus Aramenus sulfurataquae]
MAVILKIIPKEPISFYTRAIKSYYFSEKDYIPATTLRGAILKAFMDNSNMKPEEFYNKALNFYISPAYPLMSAPAHPFVLAVSRKDKRFLEMKDSLKKLEDRKEDLNISGDWKKNLKITIYLIKKYSKEKLGVDQYPKSRPGTIIKLVKYDQSPYGFESVSTKSIINMHVAINKFHASSEAGMLFAYEYKELPELWAIASEDLGVKEAFVGKSRYKGAGKIKIEKIKDYQIRNPEPGSWAYCLSPCIDKLEVGNSKKIYFEWETILGKQEIYNSWFTYKDLMGRKPSLKVISPGSIVKVNKVNEIDELKPAGLNFMMKINDLRSFILEVSK